MQKRYLLDIGSQCKQTHQRAPSAELGVGQGYQSLPGRRGGAVTIASGQMALPIFLSDDGWLIVGYGCDGELRLSVLRGVGRSFYRQGMKRDARLWYILSGYQSHSVVSLEYEYHERFMTELRLQAKVKASCRSSGFES
jgi:hypothetical protein